MGPTSHESTLSRKTRSLPLSLYIYIYTVELAYNEHLAITNGFQNFCWFALKLCIKQLAYNELGYNETRLLRTENWREFGLIPCIRARI